MNGNCLLSICIPTYKRPEILRNTLNSIYAQGVDHALFEVCISDDSPTDESEDVVRAEFADVDNLIYHRTAECGYLNLVEALKLGSGRLLKLHNDYASFREGGLQKMIDLINRYSEEEPVLFFGLKSLKNDADIMEFSAYDSFMKDIDYMCTFCSSFSVWKEDFGRVLSKDAGLNFAFPHTSLLFRMTYKKRFVVDNSDYVSNQPLSKKGGYNLPEYFVKEYLTMAEQDLLQTGHISRATYGQLEHSILKFTADWYVTVRHDDRYTFSFEDCEKIIESRCGLNGVKMFKRYVGGAQRRRKFRQLARRLLGRA